jgi:hypothetical protein
MTCNPRIALVPVLVLMACIWAGAASAADEPASFNNVYSPPFGSRPDVRVENAARFSYFTQQGAVEGVDKAVHGGIFSLNLAMEDRFGFELKTIWARQEEDVAFVTCGGDAADCQSEGQYFSGSQVTIGLTPQYKFLNKDWVWGAVALEVLFPLQTGLNPAKLYEINPGFQFYFDTGDWFGVELDVAMLMTVADPPETPYVPGYKFAPDDNEVFVAGAYARANFLLKIIGQHFINLQVEDNIYLHQLEGSREQTVARMVGRDPRGEYQPTRVQDYVDMAFYSNHRLDVGAGYRVNLKIFEGGVGAFVAITDRDKRQGWGMQVDTRFTF